ncbi:MAG: hypothetical protein ACFUZC_08790 [Chthoniobacteraceae bacterium]
MNLKRCIHSTIGAFAATLFVFLSGEGMAVGAPAQDITCWGDSLTQNGVGVALASLYSGVRKVHNEGVGGEPSTGIAVRQGGTPIRLMFPENSMSASGTMTIQATTENGDPKIRHTIKGSVQGIPGTLTRIIANGSFVWSRTNPGSAVPVPPDTVMDVETGDSQNHTVVLWYGRNNVGSNQTVEYVKGDLERSIERLKCNPKPFVILGVTRSDYPAEYTGGVISNRINTLNAWIKAKWPDNYIDPMACLIAAHDPNNPQDIIDIKNGVIPFSLRKQGDKTHLNPNGDMVLAREIKKMIDAKGW